jgi:uncharacterized membrane protein
MFMIRSGLLLPIGEDGPSSRTSLAKSDFQAWVPIVGGGALVLFGLSRRSLGGLVLASIGGLLIYRGVMPRPASMRTGAATTIARSPEDLYSFWRNFENLPRVMENLESVRQIDERRSHWAVKTVGELTIEWDAEIVEEEPNRYIAWRSDENAEIATNGIIRFDPAPGNRGTEVHLTLEYSLPLGTLGAADAAILGSEPSQRARADLQRFKQFIETGEAATTAGQPAGERGRAPDPETIAGAINNLLEGLNIVRTGGRDTRGRAGTRV